MYEYHGWIVVRATGDWPVDVWDDQELSPEAEAAIAAQVDARSGYGLMDRRPLNGLDAIHFAGHPNHRGGTGDLIEAFFADIGRLAPGSYGLLYVYDDELPDPEGNHFRVFRMVRGHVTSAVDALLSPVFPTLEDLPPD